MLPKRKVMVLIKCVDQVIYCIIVVKKLITIKELFLLYYLIISIWSSFLPCKVCLTVLYIQKRCINSMKFCLVLFCYGTNLKKPRGQLLDLKMIH